ncbi:MAG: HIRAN domain-containing protein [Clostridia bacterium]
MKKELWLIWKEPTSRKRHVVGTLIKHNTNYTFKYNLNEVEEAKKNGFDYFPGFNDVKKIYQGEKLFTNIIARLPNVNREDYVAILESYNLTKENDAIEILEKTKGRLLTDTFEFVPVFNETNIEFEIAATRYSQDIKKCINLLKVGDNVILELEKNNQYDKNAVIIFIDKNNNKHKLGYVPNYYAEYIATALKKEKHEYTAKIINLKENSLINDEQITVKLDFV